MLTEEQKQRIEESTKESINTWVKSLFIGPVMEELIEAQTRLMYISNKTLLPEDRESVKEIVQENVKRLMLVAFEEHSNNHS